MTRITLKHTTSRPDQKQVCIFWKRCKCIWYGIHSPISFLICAHSLPPPAANSCCASTIFAKTSGSELINAVSHHSERKIEKRKPKPSYYSIQVSDLQNVLYVRLSGVFDAAPCGCELGFRVYGSKSRAEVLNFANLKVRPSRVRCRVKSNMPEKTIPGGLNIEICPLPQKGRLAVADSKILSPS